MYRGSAPSSVTSPHTAVVEIRGEISEGSDASAEFVNSALRAAFEDEGARAVVLLINSPGGSPVQAGMMNDEILRLKAKHKKPVYAVVEETCASAAYYIAVAADQIYVDKASIVGSIGVLMDGFGFTGLMDKLGVERRLLTACHLVGADHHGVGKGGGHRMRLGQRQSLRQCGWHFAGERCFVNVGGGYGKWNAQPLQQLLAVARGRT